MFRMMWSFSRLGSFALLPTKNPINFHFLRQKKLYRVEFHPILMKNIEDLLKVFNVLLKYLTFDQYIIYISLHVFPQLIFKKVYWPFSSKQPLHSFIRKALLYNNRSLDQWWWMSSLYHWDVRGFNGSSISYLMSLENISGYKV
jgi:hypothetical protein